LDQTYQLPTFQRGRDANSCQGLAQKLQAQKRRQRVRWGRNPEINFRGEPRSSSAHASATDVDDRLHKKSQGDISLLCHMGHILVQNRSGLVVYVEVTKVSGAAECGAALAMLGRSTNQRKRVIVRADKGYDCKPGVKGCRRLKVTPHVAAKGHHSAIGGRMKSSLNVRKRIKGASGLLKTVGSLWSRQNSSLG
jgi:hypothetical protein